MKYYQTEKSIRIMEHYKKSKLLNDLAVSKLLQKHGLKYMILQAVNIPLTKIQGLKIQC